MDAYEKLERAFELRGTPANTRKCYPGMVGRFFDVLVADPAHSA
jgi:hypothetical protein